MKLKYTSLFTIGILLMFGSCKEEKTVFENPYEGAKEPLGIVTNAQQIPIPESGIAGTEVTIAATGLLKHKDKLQFQFNGEEAQIVSVTETGIKVKVPAKASSGITSFVVDGQLVFGPNFTVNGKVKIDPTFATTIGTNGPVLRAIPLTGGNLMLLGDFTNYDNRGLVRPINRITRVFANGAWDRSFLSGTAAHGTVTSLASLGGFFYIAGNFGGYAQQGGINRITKIAPSGILDTMEIKTYLEKSRYVARFNGGVNNTINNVYAFNGKIIAVGNFTYYLRRRFDKPTVKYQDSIITDSTDVRQLARYDENGKLDSTWRFDKMAPGYGGTLGKSLPGGNGPINSLMHEDGKILCFGQFSTFDNVNKGRIVRLTPDGMIDPTFNAGGAGADDFIYNVTYDKKSNKYIAVGRFRTYNGTPSLNMVRLNYDGTVDQSFSPKIFTAGQPYYAKILSDGLIVVSGDFRTYDTVVRNGFMILNPDGSLADGYNTIGNVAGSTQKFFDVYETVSADNKRALLIMGSFYSFDNKPRNNIVRVTLE